MHAQASIEKAVASLHARGLDPGSAGVYFGQLLGMADNLSFVLGANGYRVRMSSAATSHLSHDALLGQTLIFIVYSLVSACKHAWGQAHGDTVPLHLRQ